MLSLQLDSRDVGSFYCNSVSNFIVLAHESPSLHRMTAEYLQFHHKNATLAYQKAGNGTETLLLFHGFGQDHSVFAPIIEAYASDFTFYSFDLFFHGKSKWPSEDTPLSKKYWQEMLGQFLKENEIDNFSALGFSLGGKFALASFESFPKRVNHLFLLSPDGIKTSTWYNLATYPFALRAFFKSMITNPARFHAIVNMAEKLRLVDKMVLKFAQSQMEREEQRSRVYYSWVVFRHLKFPINELASIINFHPVQLTIFIGQFDKIITTSSMKNFLSKVPQAIMHELPTGHNGLIKECVKELRK